MSSTKPLPPPPKLSGLVTPAGSASASSSSFATPAPSRYRTTPAATSTPATARPLGRTTTSTTKTSTSSSSSKSSSSAPSASYESHAPRSADQRARLARIAALTAGPCPGLRPPPPPSKSGKPANPSPAAPPVLLAEATCPPPSLLRASSSFEKFSDLSGGMGAGAVDPAVASALNDASLRAAALTTLVRHAASLRLALRASLNIADDVQRRHAELLRHSGELSAAAERLQHEERMLTDRAEEIGMPLKHYDAVDRIGPLVGVHFKDGGHVVRGAARLHVDSTEEFAAVLAQVDEAVEFFGGAAGGAGGGGGGPEDPASGGAEYLRRARALQDAALELLRAAVADRISQTADHVRDAVGRDPVAADKLEASPVYTRFHGISRRSSLLVSIARGRLDALGGAGRSGGGPSPAAAPYEEFLALCRNTYCGARESLLGPTVRAHMDALMARHGLVGMTRLASVFLIRLCTVETALYLDFFGDPERRRRRGPGRRGGEGKDGADGEGGEGPIDDGVDTQPFKRMGSAGGHAAAAALASQILSEDSTYRDAEFQSMLGSLCAALHRTVRRGLVSVLDLDVLCQVVGVLREERAAANSSPTTLAAARAVSGVIQDAQERLIFCANSALHKEVVRFKPSPGDLNYPGKLLGEKPKVAIVVEDDSGGAGSDEAKDDDLGSEGGSEKDDAVAAQIRVYESWFPPMRSVLRILSKIFRVVEPRVFEDIALQSVRSCTKSLKDGSAHVLRRSGQIHADLFLVKHLLILREQLSPFDIQLRSVERQLDFSEAGTAVARFLASRNRRLFSMSTENALVALLREGVSVQESSVDSKRDLEDCLRSACNDFIEHAAMSLLGPIAGLVDKCKSTDTPAGAPFMNGTLVKGVFSSALANFDGEFEEISCQMGLYLENTATQGILLKPVVRKMTRSLEEARRFVSEARDEENGWDSEIRAEVMKSLDEYEAKVKSANAKK